MKLLHISDTHLDSTDAPNAHGVNARQSLRQMLSDLGDVLDVDVLVVSGDIADDGSTEAYRAARQMLGDFARVRNIPTICSTGNHDERGGFAEILGSGHWNAGGQDLAEELVRSQIGERAAATVVNGYRFVTLDSLVPGKGYGLISQTQLSWLSRVLAVPAPNGTVLVFHHPPITLDVEVQRALGLQNPAELADIIRGTDVRMILCGHFHLQLFGHLEATPVWVTPGVVNRIDLTAPPGTERAVRGASTTIVEFGGPNSPMIHLLHARDPQVGETVWDLDESQLKAVIQRLGS